MRWILFVITLLTGIAAIDAASRTTLILRFEWLGKSSTNGQVFWSTDAREFREERSTRFDVKPGAQTVGVDLPSDTRWVRFDPVEDAGGVRLSGARIHSTLLPFDYAEFDRPALLQAWVPDPGNHLKNPVLKGDALEYQSTGIDPYVMSPPLYGYAYSRWFQILLEAFLLATAAALVVPASRAGSRRWVAYGAATTAAVTGLALGASQLWQKTRWFGADPRDISVPGYDLSFYDMWGRAVSTRRGPLALVIDPYTIYRNYPGQASEKFRIDADGFRESGPAKPGAKTAFVLGGSTTFGLAAPSDEDTFVARMSAADSTVNFRNAGVVGFQSGQELALMIHHLDAFAPRLYLVVDGWNDLEQNLQDPHGDDLGFNHSTFDLFQDHLFQLASLQASGLPGARAAISRRGESDGFEDKLIGRYLENVERMSAFAKSRGAGFALALQPALVLKGRFSPTEERRMAGWKDSKPMKRAATAYQRLARETLALCARLHVPCIDLNADAEFSSTSETIFADDCHFTPEGNRWAAAKLAAFLKTSREPGSR